MERRAAAWHQRRSPPLTFLLQPLLRPLVDVVGRPLGIQGTVRAGRGERKRPELLSGKVFKVFNEGCTTDWQFWSRQDKTAN